MQSGRNAMESMKESAANAAASTKSGMEKTKATMQEKVSLLLICSALCFSLVFFFFFFFFNVFPHNLLFQF